MNQKDRINNLFKGKISGIAIRGISCALPTNRVASIDRYNDFGKEAVDKIIAKTGVESVYKSHEKQTGSDLAFAAAKHLIEKNHIDINAIKILVLVTQTPDYRMPSTAYVLQHRLGMSEECLCFDVNLGCSGYVSGLFAISSILSNSNAQKGLLLVAETPSKRISPLDRSLSMIFGDCGTATLVEKDSNAKSMIFKFKSFGERFKKIIVPAGGYRNMHSPTERVMWDDGNIRSDYDTYMNGQDVFAFSILEVPKYIKGFLEENCCSQGNYDYIVLHQANEYILRQIGKKLKADLSKIPISMKEYGNTSSTSIPLTLSYLKSQSIKRENSEKRFLLSGFGIGLSWSIADVCMETKYILPVIHTDDYYEDGFIPHGNKF